MISFEEASVAGGEPRAGADSISAVHDRKAQALPGSIQNSLAAWSIQAHVKLGAGEDFPHIGFDFQTPAQGKSPLSPAIKRKP